MNKIIFTLALFCSFLAGATGVYSPTITLNFHDAPAQEYTVTFSDGVNEVPTTPTSLDGNFSVSVSATAIDFSTAGFSIAGANGYYLFYNPAILGIDSGEWANGGSLDYNGSSFTYTWTPSPPPDTPPDTGGNTNGFAITPEFLQTNMEAVLNSGKTKDAFNAGLSFGAIVAAFAWCLAFLKTISGGNSES